MKNPFRKHHYATQLDKEGVTGQLRVSHDRATLAVNGGNLSIKSTVASVAKYRATIWRLTSLVSRQQAFQRAKTVGTLFGKIRKLCGDGERHRKNRESGVPREKRSGFISKLAGFAFGGDVTVKVSPPCNGGSG